MTVEDHPFEPDPGLWNRAPCGYLITTDDGLVVEANLTILDDLGRDAADVVGRVRFADLLSGGGRMYHETHFVPMLRMHGEIEALALDLRRADGSRLPVLVSARRFDRGDGLHGVQIVTFDARERRSYERELLRAKQRAEASEGKAIALARTLQATLIPPLAPAVAGLDIATAYRPAANGDEVGGDFYDIFQVAEDEWVLTIGDVEGKGVGAAAVTALARHVLRAAAVRSASPREALLTLNDVLLRAETTRLLTAVVMRLSRVGDAWQTVSASAGHTPPVALRPGQPPAPLGLSGTILGAVPSPRVDEHETELRTPDIAFLSTDGVSEARSPRTAEFYGDERVSALLQRFVGGSVHRLVDALVADVVNFSDGNTRDDVAVLAVSVSG